MKTSGYTLIAHLYGYNIYKRETLGKKLFIAKGRRSQAAPIQDIRFMSSKNDAEIVNVLSKRLFDGYHQKIFDEI